MTPYSLAFPLAVFLTALLTTHLLIKSFGAPSEIGRQSTLDGLRGILAFTVFLCHAGVWHYFISTDRNWDYPEGPYAQFGKSSVYMFFMITGFLFTSKNINDREKGIDWIRLFVSRVLRIFPLYFAAVILMIFIVLIESHFQIKGTRGVFLIGIVRWFTFTIFGDPFLNNYNLTRVINSNVQWTLVYEWLFYLSLPLLALIMHIRVPAVYIAASAALVMLFVVNMQNLFFPFAFLAGILTAFIFRFAQIRLLLSHPIFSVVAIALIVLQAWYSPEAAYQQPSRIPALCLTIAFIIACGNSLFGFLSTKSARYLGEVSYGVYLLHGIILFCTFKYIVGFEQVKTLSPISYWAVVSAITVLMLIAATLTYRTIEAPAMRQVSTVRSRLRTQFGI